MPRDTETLLKTPRFHVVRAEHDDGSLPPREVIRHPGAVTILPVLEDGRICLIRNYRLAAGETLIELPAGTLEPGEDPRETAFRELAEETGYRAGQMEHLHTFFLSPGILDERMRLFLATGLAAGEPRREPGELIENQLVTLDEALRLIDAGKIRDAKTIVGLLLWERRGRRTHGE